MMASGSRFVKFKKGSIFSVILMYWLTITGGMLNSGTLMVVMTTAFIVTIMPAPILAGDKDKDKDKDKDDKDKKDKEDKDKKDKEDKDKDDKDKKDKDKGKRKKTVVPVGKVTMCHKSSDAKFVEITVAASAQLAHLSHGDYLGICSTIDTASELQVIGCKEPYLTKLIETVRVKKVAEEDGGEPADLGVSGGHFDLDTSTAIYSPNFGITNKHEHEWDDKHDLTSVDFFQIAGSGFDEIDNTLSVNQKFYITVANAPFSTSGVLDINGEHHNVVDYQQDTMNKMAADKDLIQAYMLGKPSLAQQEDGIKQLSSLKLNFDVNAILSGGLIPTNTGCVKKNQPGMNKEYRNGALLVQVLDSTAYQIDPVLGHATKGLLWEASVFWHWDPSECYGDPDWQAVYDKCIIDGGCLSASKHSSKAKTYKETDKIYVCHQAGKDGKYVKLHISKNAACVHLGYVPDENGLDTGAVCVPKGHVNDDFIKNKSDQCAWKSEDVVAEDVTKVTVDYQTAVDDCLDPTKGGGTMGTSKSGRLNWKQILTD